MAIKYISTAVKGAAHESDILGVAVTAKHTVTVSSDGYLKLWKNDSFERNLELQKLVDPLGVHHVTVFEDTSAETGAKILLFGVVGFSGKFYLLAFDYKTSELTNLDFTAEIKNNKSPSYWAPCFIKDSENGKDHYLAITTVTGRTQVFTLLFENDAPQFTHQGEAYGNDDSFATCITADAKSKKITVGHQNGSVYLYDLQRLMLTFNFETYGLKQSNKSINIVRAIEFSPNGELLAIARDSGAYGTVSIYDVKYGEFLGSFTIATHSSNVGVGSFAHSKWCMTLSFNASGTLLATGGFDDRVRIWDVETRQCEASIILNTTDMSDEELEQAKSLDESKCVSLKFVAPGLIEDDGKNDGVVVVGLDRTVRWFREAGGI